MFAFSKQGSTPTPWAWGLRDQIQKWALQAQKTLYFQGFLCSEGDRDHGLRPWSRKGPDHGVGIDPSLLMLKKSNSNLLRLPMYMSMLIVYESPCDTRCWLHHTLFPVQVVVFVLFVVHMFLLVKVVVLNVEYGLLSVEVSALDVCKIDELILSIKSVVCDVDMSCSASRLFSTMTINDSLSRSSSAMIIMDDLLLSKTWFQVVVDDALDGDDDDDDDDDKNHKIILMRCFCLVGANKQHHTAQKHHCCNPVLRRQTHDKHLPSNLLSNSPSTRPSTPSFPSSRPPGVL